MNEAQSPPPVSTADSSQVRTSIAAIWSLVFGILSFCLSIFGFIPALILGIFALVKINGSEGRLTGKGLAIAGIVTGSIGVFVGAIAIAILMPAMTKVQDRAISIKEANDVRSLVIACNIYASDWDGAFPEKLQDLYPDYMGDQPPLRAVNPKTKDTEDYIYFPGLTKASRSNLPLIASPFVNRGKRVVGIAGGHVKAMKEEEYQDLLKSAAKNS